MTANNLTFVSLYSGAGGLDLGFAQAGFRPVFANDLSSNAVTTYNNLENLVDENWQTARNMFENHKARAGNIHDFMDELKEGMADMVIGGPPCQGFSMAGKMNPKDPRSQHVFTFFDVVTKIKPRAFVLENVPNLAKSPHWLRLLKAVRGKDYKVTTVVLNSKDWGVPQARKRMFLIGIPVDCEDVVFGEGPTKKSPITAREVLSTLPPAGTLGNESICQAKITLAKNPILRPSPFAGMLFNGGGRVINLSEPSQTLPASMGGNRTPIIDVDWLESKEIEPWIVRYHRHLFIEKKPPLKTLPEDVNMRRITTQEAAILQSFPRGLEFSGPQSKVYEQIGNAVPPKLAFHVAKAVRKALEE